MKRGEMFSDLAVRGIKEALLRGTHPKALARLHHCGPGTIIRIRDGETYKHVKVEGEEMFWKELDFIGADGPGVGELAGRKLPVVVEKTERELDEMAEESLRLLGIGVGQDTGPAGAPTVAADPLEAQARDMLGLGPREGK